MARKKAPINLKSCERLKTLLDEYNMSQAKLCRVADISTTHVNRIIKGKENLTDAMAEIIAKAFPEENPELLQEWLMGRNDFKDIKGQFSDVKDQLQNENYLLMNGLNCFAQLSGFTIEFTTKENEHDDFEKRIHHYTDGYTITRNDDSIQLSLIEMNRLQNEICDYIEFTLDRIVNGKRSV